MLDHFEVVVLVGACFLVNSVTQDGRTNWSEGMIMIGFYIIIVRISSFWMPLLKRMLTYSVIQALAAWYYPGEAEAHFLLQCQSIAGLLESSPVKAATAY